MFVLIDPIRHPYCDAQNKPAWRDRARATHKSQYMLESVGTVVIITIVGNVILMSPQQDCAQNAYLAPGFTPSSEPHYSMGLDVPHNLCQVLHVGSVICARHDLLVRRKFIASAGGHQALAVTHVDVLRWHKQVLLSCVQICCIR